MDSPSSSELSSSTLQNELDALLEQATRAIYNKHLWKKHYKRLKRFHKQHGHGNVPLFQKREDSLGMWVELQRQRVQQLGRRRAFIKKKYWNKLNALLGENWWQPQQEETTAKTKGEEEDIFEWKEEEEEIIRQRKIRIQDLESSSDSDSEYSPPVKKRPKLSLCDQSTAATEACSSTTTCNQNPNKSSSILDQELEIDLEDDNSSIWSYIEEGIHGELVGPTPTRKRKSSSPPDNRPRAESNASFGFDPDLFVQREPKALPRVTNKKVRTDSLAWAKGFWKDHAPPKETETKPDTCSLSEDNRKQRLDPYAHPMDLAKEEEMPAKDWL